MTPNQILRPDGLYSVFLCSFLPLAVRAGRPQLDYIIIIFSEDRETFANSSFFFLESNGSKA